MIRNLIIYGIIILTFPLTLLALSLTEPPTDNNIVSFANSHLLPDQFLIYTNGKGAINHPVPGFMKKFLPTNNDYKATPGCYIGCYSKDATHAIYAIANGIYIYGQIRVPGKYVERVCTPTGYAHKDISAIQSFKDMCAAKISTCQKKECWAGGDTGTWFGMQ